MFFRKHWKKILLALFACVWSGCEEASTGGGDLYGCPPCTCEVCDENPADLSEQKSSASIVAEKDLTDETSAVDNKVNFFFEDKKRF